MKNCLLVLSLFLCLCCKESGVRIEHPSTFVHYYNGGTPDVAQTMVKTSDGGYLILANSQSSITSNYYRIKLIKVDAYGNQVGDPILIPKVVKKGDPPARNYRGFGLTAITTTDNTGKETDAGYFIVGEEIYNDPSANNAQTHGLLMIQLSVTNGTIDDQADTVTLKKSTTMPSVRGVGVTRAKNGNFYVVGQTFSTSTDMFLAEIDASTLAPVWTRNYQGSSSSLANNLFSYGDSIYWGGTRTTGTLQQMRLISTQVNTGAQIDNNFPAGQAYTTGSPSVPISFSCSDICKHGFGYGFVGSYSVASGVYNRIAFFRVDGNGKASDSVTYKLDYPLGPPFQAAGNSLCSTQDGGFLILGTASFDASNSDTNYVLIKTDGHGVLQWTKQYGGRFVDVGTKVLQDIDGGFIVLGTTNLANVESIFLMKTDSDGNIQ